MREGAPPVRLMADLQFAVEHAVKERLEKHIRDSNEFSQQSLASILAEHNQSLVDKFGNLSLPPGRPPPEPEEIEQVARTKKKTLLPSPPPLRAPFAFADACRTDRGGDQDGRRLCVNRRGYVCACQACALVDWRSEHAPAPLDLVPTASNSYDGLRRSGRLRFRRLSTPRARCGASALRCCSGHRFLLQVLSLSLKGPRCMLVCEDTRVLLICEAGGLPRGARRGANRDRLFASESKT